MKNNDEIKLKDITPELIEKAGNLESIIDNLPAFMKIQMEQSDQQIEKNLMTELSMWQFFNQNGLIEEKDIGEVKNFFKSASKLFAVGTLIGIGLNRFFTTIWWNKSNPLNKIYGVNFFARLTCRLLIFTSVNYVICFNKSVDNFIRLHFYMNCKYSRRLKKFNDDGEPLLMNPTFYSDESYSNEDQQLKRMMYEKIRYQMKMMVMEGKEMEKHMKKVKH